MGHGGILSRILSFQLSALSFALLVALPPGVATPDSRDHARLRGFKESGKRTTLGAEEERTFDLRVKKP